MKPYIGAIIIMILLILPMAHADIPCPPDVCMGNVVAQFLTAYALTITIETIALFLILRKGYGTALIARNAVIASTLTLPFVWFVFGGLAIPWIARIVVAEAFAVLVEAGFYKISFKDMTLWKALLISFGCNLASFVIGLVVL